MTKEFVVKLIEKLVQNEVDNERGYLNINLSFAEFGTIIGALQAFVDSYKK